MPTELGRELSDRAFDEVRKTMRPGNPSIPVAACWITSLLTMPWEKLEAASEAGRAPIGENTTFRLLELPGERLLGLTWEGCPEGSGEGPERRLVQLRLPRDCLVRGFSLETHGLSSSDCRVTLTLPRRRELFTPDPHRLVVVDHNGLSLPWPGAIPLRRGEPVVAELEVRGGRALYSRQPRMILLRISYRSDVQFGLVTVRPFCVALEGDCDGSTWDLPPGCSERVREISPGVPGRLMALSAQLGPFATEARLEDLGTGECLWRVRLPLNQRKLRPRAPTLSWGASARPGWFVGGRRMAPGRSYGLRVLHDNPESYALPLAGFAEFRGLFLPARRDEWPAL